MSITPHYHIKPVEGCFRCELSADEARDQPIDLRRVQHAAWDMNLHRFCETLGWEVDDYAKDKFKQFVEAGRILANFDDTVLRTLADASKR